MLRYEITREHLEHCLAMDDIRDSDDIGVAGLFDPWTYIIHDIYGSYSSESDDLMIECMEACMNHRNHELLQEHGFAAELCLYILAGHGLLEYGTSPRSGWPMFKDLQPALIAKWKRYADAYWGRSTNCSTGS